MMKRFLSIIVLAALLMLPCSIPAFADEEVYDYYYVKTTYPADYTFSYMYDQPSSTYGNNLGKVNDGEYVFVYYITAGTGQKSSTWAYCAYRGVSSTIKGYIRWENLTQDIDCLDEGWWCTVNTTYPSGYTFSYMYDQPSSTYGNNLGKVYNGEEVYVYSITAGTGQKSSTWAYCDYYGASGTITGYIRWDNLTPYIDPPTEDGWWCTVDTIYPAGYTFSYIYDRPSSTDSNNLGKANDGESVFVYSVYGEWAYCQYTGNGRTIYGYIRYKNLRSW